MNQEVEKQLSSSDLSLAPLGLEGPTGRAYWVVEGRLMAGAYPGKKGSGRACLLGSRGPFNGWCLPG